MPSTRSLRGLQHVACPACSRPLKDAVTIACGHSVCLPCLPRTPMGAQLLCPLCQEKEEEQTQPAVTPVPLGALGETCCEEHGEKIYFFCETDAELLCVFCRESPAHQAHTVGFLDEAIQPYRVRSSVAASRRAGWGPACRGWVKEKGWRFAKGIAQPSSSLLSPCWHTHYTLFHLHSATRSNS